MKLKILADSSEHLNQSGKFNKGKCTLLSKLTFWWLTPLLWQGFFEPLELEDLGSLPEKETSRFHYDQFLFTYHKNSSPEAGKSGNPLWLCYLRTIWPMFTLGGFLKLFGDFASLVGPVSISYIVDYFIHLNNATGAVANASSSIDSNDNDEEVKVFKLIKIQEADIDFPNWNNYLCNGWIMAFMVLIFALVQGTLSQASTHLINMEGIKIRNALQGLIYRKTLLLSSNSSSLQTSEAKYNRMVSLVGEVPAADPGNITNLVSEDTFNVMSLIWVAHYVWAIPLKVFKSFATIVILFIPEFLFKFCFSFRFQ